MNSYRDLCGSLVLIRFYSGNGITDFRYGQLTTMYRRDQIQDISVNSRVVR